MCKSSERGKSLVYLGNRKKAKWAVGGRMSPHKRGLKIKGLGSWRARGHDKAFTLSLRVVGSRQMVLRIVRFVFLNSGCK